MSELKLFLFGPPRLEREGQPIHVRRRLGLALAAYLLVSRQPHSREELAALFWPEQDTSTARANLRRELSRLNKLLGPGPLRTEGDMIFLSDHADVWVDVVHFQQLLSDSQQHPHPANKVCRDCLARLDEAAALYTTDFLTGFTITNSPAFDDWQSLQTESLRQALAAALERLERGTSDQNEFEAAITYARWRLSLDPLHEAAHRRLMQLYAQTGQISAALRQYQQCVQILSNELNIGPSQETLSLYQQLRSGNFSPTSSQQAKIGEITATESTVATRLIASSSSDRTAIPNHNLPAQTTPFIGRAEEMAELTRLLVNPTLRLITIVGPGGVGKTRLAVEVSATLGENFQDGIYFAPLASLESPASIIPAIAQALNFSFYQGGTLEQQLHNYLRQKQLLLLLDNCEHLLISSVSHSNEQLNGTDVVVNLLAAAPNLKILATSRASLNLQAEQRFPLRGIDFPEEAIFEGVSHYSALQLFEQSAKRIQPDFAITNNESGDVARICRLVQGMPLGIILAATWVELLTPAEISAEIGRNLDFLDTEFRDVPERHQSLRAVFDHSWRLLSETERDVFRQLSVFRGSFTRQAAQAVASASLQTLLALVNKSFLQRISGDRFEIHELLRQYGAERLNQAPPDVIATGNRHSAYYCAFLQEREADLKGAQHQAALTEIETEIENIQMAWTWAIERSQIEHIWRAIDCLGLVYDWLSRFQEGRAIYRLAADQVSSMASSDALRMFVRILTWLSHFNRELGQREAATQLLSRGLDLLNSPELAEQDTRSERAFILIEMPSINAENPAKEKRWRLYEESLALYRAIGDRWWEARILNFMAWVARQQADYDQAKQFTEESLTIFKSLNHESKVVANLLTSSAFGALQQGQLEEGEQLIRESYAIHRKLGKSEIMGRGHRNLGVVLTLLGNFADGYTHLEQSEAIYSDLGHHAVIFSTTWLALANMHLGRYERARKQGQQGLRMAQENKHVGLMGNAHWVLGCLALTNEAPVKARELLQESVANYRAVGQKHELSVAVAGLAYAERNLGHSSQARQCLQQALQSVETHAFYPLIVALPAAALLLADQNQPEQAVELYTLASGYSYVANSRWFEDVAGRQIAAITDILPPEVVTAAQTRGRARELWEAAGSLLKQFERM